MGICTAHFCHRVALSCVYDGCCPVLLYFRRNHWQFWLESDATAASQLLSSLFMSWKTRRCVSAAAQAKSLRAVEMTSSLWCTRHRFKVKFDVTAVFIGHMSARQACKRARLSAEFRQTICLIFQRSLLQHIQFEIRS